MLARAVTSIARVVGQLVQTSSHEAVPFREELFSAAKLGTPNAVADALQKVQRHISESTQAARSLPCLGGCYFPNFQLGPGVNTIIAHRVPGNVPVTFWSLGHSTGASVWMSDQNVARGTVTMQASATIVCDLWFFPAPVAGPQSGVSSLRSTPATMTAGAACCLNNNEVFGPATVAAVANNFYAVDVSAGLVTLNLPTLALYQGVRIKHVNGSPATHNLVINPPAGVKFELPPPNNASQGTFFSLTALEDYGTSICWRNYGVSGVYSIE